MRKIRDVLECIFTKELSHRATAKLLRVNRRTVTNYLERFKKSKLPWPLPAHMDNEKLENTLFLNAALPNSSDKKPIIDFPKVHTELQKKGATLAILHQEWQETVPPHNHISYSQYCRLYNLFKKTLQVSMR